jgi:NAD(P)-dependent dehydrogenase (short-subunit alcohol dehydrogenase family)
MLSECLRYELAPQGVSVVLVKPAAVATPIWTKGRGKFEEVVSGLPDDAKALYGRQLVKVRGCGDHESACACSSLAGRESDVVLRLQVCPSRG